MVGMGSDNQWISFIHPIITYSSFQGKKYHLLIQRQCPSKQVYGDFIHTLIKLHNILNGSSAKIPQGHRVICVDQLVNFLGFHSVHVPLSIFIPGNVFFILQNPLQTTPPPKVFLSFFPTTN